MARSDPEAALVPPYISFANFLIALRALALRGVPECVRGGDFQELRPSNQAQLAPALRFLGLLDSNLAPTSKLHLLVCSFDSADFAGELAKILDERYPKLATLDLATCAPGALTKALAPIVTSDEVGRKAARFYLNAAREAGKEIGPRLQFGRRAPRQGREAPQTSKAMSTPEGLHHRRAMARLLPPFDPTWPTEVKVAWLQSFGKLAETC